MQPPSTVRNDALGYGPGSSAPGSQPSSWSLLVWHDFSENCLRDVPAQIQQLSFNEWSWSVSKGCATLIDESLWYWTQVQMFKAETAESGSPATRILKSGSKTQAAPFLSTVGGGRWIWRNPCENIKVQWHMIWFRTPFHWGQWEKQSPQWKARHCSPTEEHMLLSSDVHQATLTEQHHSCCSNVEALAW